MFLGIEFLFPDGRSFISNLIYAHKENAIAYAEEFIKTHTLEKIVSYKIVYMSVMDK